MKNVILAAVAVLSIGTVAEATTYSVFVTAQPYRQAPLNNGLQTRAVVLSPSGPQNFNGASYSINLPAMGSSIATNVFGMVAYDAPVDADDYIPGLSTATFDFGAFGIRTISGSSFATSANGAIVDYGDDISFNVGGGMRVLVSLADTTFGTSSGGTFVNGRPGIGFVQATFTLAAVPVPATLPLGIAALGLLGFAARRREKAA